MKMKKTLAVLLALTMCLSLLPMSAFAYGDADEKLEIVVGFGDIDDSNLPTLNLTTRTDHSLTLTMPNETVKGGYKNVTVAVKRWEDGSTPVLDYPQTYDGGDKDLEFDNLLGKFHAFCASGDNALTVTWRDGGEEKSAAYRLHGNGSAFIAETNDGNASTVWEKITDDANRSLTTKSNTDNTDSYIVLAAGSYFEMYGGRIRVDEKFKLDNFDDLDSIADEFEAKTTFDDAEGPNAFEVALKKGTTLAVGTDLITLLRDVTITLNGDTDFAGYLDDPSQCESDLEYLDIDIHSPVNGTAVAQDLVNYINDLFGAIAEHKTGSLELTFDFGGAAATEASIIGEGEQVAEASASAAIAEAAEGNVYVAQGGDVTLGGATVATQITVAKDSNIAVESSAAETGTKQTANTSEITYTDATTNNPQTAYVVSTNSTTTTSAAAVALVAENFKVDDTVNDGSGEPTSYVDLTQVITSIAAAATDEEMETIATVDTTWTLKLDDSTLVTPAVEAEVDSAVGDVANKDTEADSVYVDVQPVMTVTRTEGGTNVTSTAYTVPNTQLAADAKFQYTIEGLTAGKTYHIYHKRADGVEDLGDRIANSAGKVTIELTSFSPIVAVPLTAPTPGSYGAEIVSMNSYLGEFFILNLYVKTAEAAPTFHFERDCTPYTYTLLQSADKSEFVNDPKATYYVEEITTTDPVKNALDITNAYKGKAMESGYHYYMVSVKLYTAFLDQDVIMSMEDGLGNGMTIKDYSYNGGSYTLGSNNVAATQAHSFVDYLGMMNTYYTKESDAETAGYYSDLYTGLTAAAAAAREVAAPGS